MNLRDQEEHDRMFLKNEVQRISSTYNEEQQKLELMNKVRETMGANDDPHDDLKIHTIKRLQPMMSSVLPYPFAQYFPSYSVPC